MKPVRLIGTGILLLLLGTCVPAYAQQDEHKQDANSSKQEQQAKPEERQQNQNRQQEQRVQQQRQADRPSQRGQRV